MMDHALFNPFIKNKYVIEVILKNRHAEITHKNARRSTERLVAVAFKLESDCLFCGTCLHTVLLV